MPSAPRPLTLAAQVAGSGPGALLGGFVHSTNWDPAALRHLFEAAAHHGLDVDLHVDEELNPAAQGLATTAALLRELDFAGHVVCGHTCALAMQDATAGAGHAGRRGALAHHAGHAARHQPAAAGRHHRPHAAHARPHAGQGSPRTRHPAC